MRQRMRANIDADKHPFLFVSFHGAQRGEPYTIDAYQNAYDRAIRRIGLDPAKFSGTTPHGLRHAWGHRAKRGELNPLVIQEGLHQKSPESQAVYTQPSAKDVTAALEAATAALAAGESFPMPLDLDSLIDTGRYKVKLRRPHLRSSNDA
jgi:integrase